MAHWIETVADGIWSAPVIFVLFVTFVYITIQARFPQRRLLSAFVELFRGKGAYRAVSVNLSAVLGVGNIAGVAMAVAAGGPGAVFWCFVSGLAGVGVQFAECLICAKYTHAGGIGGPMYVLQRFGMKKSAFVYASAVCLCGLLIGAAIPANTVVRTVMPSLTGSQWLIAGALLAFLAALVISGGGRHAADFCAYVIPPTIAVYICVCGGILYIARESVGEAIALIFEQAFAMRPAAAGVAGYGFARAVRWGTARGLFSSEAGMGTAGITASEEVSGSPTARALGCACSAVIDTLILATLTGICFVSAALETGMGFSDASKLISGAFSLFPYIGKYFILICVTFLGFSTIIGWYWVADRACGFLFPGIRRGFFARIWLLAILLGPSVSGNTIWSACDILNVFLLVPNLCCILRMLPHCGAELDLISRSGREPVKIRLFRVHESSGTSHTNRPHGGIRKKA